MRAAKTWGSRGSTRSARYPSPFRKAAVITIITNMRKQRPAMPSRILSRVAPSSSHTRKRLSRRAAASECHAPKPAGARISERSGIEFTSLLNRCLDDRRYPNRKNADDRGRGRIVRLSTQSQSFIALPLHLRRWAARGEVQPEHAAIPIRAAIIGDEGQDVGRIAAHRKNRGRSPRPLHRRGPIDRAPARTVLRELQRNLKDRP